MRLVILCKPGRPDKNAFRRKQSFHLLLALSGLLPIPLHAQWTQTWGGDFPGTAGSTYNHSNWWNNVQSSPVWGDGTQQTTSDSTNNVYVDGQGNLILAMTYSPGATYPYTSARLTSKEALGPYGRFDTRIQNPAARGMGAAFWALGADAYPASTAPSTSNPSTQGGVPWPYCGELDMMEIQAATAGHNGSTVHGSNYGTDTWVSTPVDLTSPATFDNGFHVFTTEWKPYHFFYYLDNSNTSYGDVGLADTPFNDTWELNQPVNLILSSGIGGNGGTPGTTGFPANLTVSYVNYSQWSAGAPAAVTSLAAKATYSNAVNLSWNASTTPNTTYDIYASTAPSTAPSIATLVAQNVAGTTYLHTGLQPGMTYYYTVVAANFGGESKATSTTVTTPAAGNSTGVQLSAGGWAVGTYMNSKFVVGGNSNAHLHVPINTSQVANAAPQQVYDTERWGAAAWTINGLTPNAGYTVTLHFVETTHTASGQRAFNVSLNSATVLTNFDIFAAAGGQNIAVTRQFFTDASSAGIIELQTQLGTGSAGDLNPTISAIEITPASGSNPVGATPGNLSSLAINAGGGAAAPYLADTDYNSGEAGAIVTNLINVGNVSNPAPQAVYQSSHIAPTTYVLTNLQAKATYNLRLHFAETYFTTANQRLFNVAVNGQPFLTNFDIFSAAGAADTAVIKSVSTQSDQYGQLVVQFLPGSANTPQVNGLDVTLTSASVTPTAVNIDAGSSSAVGNFSVDTGYSGGSAYAPGRTVTITAGTANVAPAAVYETSREGVFTYTVPGFAANSAHNVVLHFAELYWASTGSRTFNVAINGQNVLSNFDIVAAAGGHGLTAVVQQLTGIKANSNGQYVISFTNGQKDQPSVSGISIQ